MLGQPADVSQASQRLDGGCTVQPNPIFTRVEQVGELARFGRALRLAVWGIGKGPDSERDGVCEALVQILSGRGGP